MKVDSCPVVVHICFLNNAYEAITKPQVVTCFVLLCLTLPTVVLAASVAEMEAVRREADRMLIVKFFSTPKMQEAARETSYNHKLAAVTLEAEDVASKLDCVSVKRPLSPNHVSVVIEDGCLKSDAISQLESDPGVEYVDDVQVLHPTSQPNDPEYLNLWGMSAIDAETAWSKYTGGRQTSEKVKVCVMDSGMDRNHPDLMANMGESHNGYNGSVTCEPDAPGCGDMKHGTHDGGTIAAVGNNAEGVTGVNWSAELLSCQMTQGIGRSDAWLTCLTWCMDKGALIISGSSIVRTCNVTWYEKISSPNFTGSRWPCPEEYRRQQDLPRWYLEEYGKLCKKGGMFVAGAGNEHMDLDVWPAYPASLSGKPGIDCFIVVAATRLRLPQDVAATRPRLPQDVFDTAYSNYGKKTVHLGAPGTHIRSTVPRGGYDVMKGTSMAQPHVSGAVALLYGAAKEYGVSAKLLDIKKLILDTVTLDVTTGYTITGGRLNLGAAMEKLLESSPEPVSPEPVSPEPVSPEPVSPRPVPAFGNCTVVTKYGTLSSQKRCSECQWHCLGHNACSELVFEGYSVKKAELPYWQCGDGKWPSATSGLCVQQDANGIMNIMQSTCRACSHKCMADFPCTSIVYNFVEASKDELAEFCPEA